MISAKNTKNDHELRATYQPWVANICGQNRHATLSKQLLAGEDNVAPA